MNGAARLAGRMALLAALAATLAACHTTRVVWAKPGGDDAELRSDQAACTEQAQGAARKSAARRTSTAAAPTPDIATYGTTTYGTVITVTNTPTRPDQQPTPEMQDAGRVQVNCMIGRGWRLTPLP